MVKTIVGIDGMMCGMCENHIQDAIRNNFKVKKVKASRGKKQAEIISEQPLDEAAVKKVIDDTGYEFTGITSEPYEKKHGLFSRK